MKTLLLLRHGKSDWNAGYGSDAERPLAPRGIRAARSVGRFLAEVSQVPDLVLSSPAVRARGTVELAVEAGQWACPVEIVPALYSGGPEEALAGLALQSDHLDSILLAGHEPTWSELCHRLTGARARVPTACLVRIALACDRWVDASTARGELLWILPPRLLQAATSS